MIDPGPKDRVALVTDGNNPFGIGAAIARALASHGARVFVHYLCQPSGLPDDRCDRHATGSPGLAFFYQQQAKTAEEVVASIREAGGEAKSWEVDLSEPDSADRLFERAEGAFGHVVILVNNAAHYSADTFVRPEASDGDPVLWEDGPTVETIDSSTHDLHLGVNCRAVALLMRAFAGRIIQRQRQWGRIINISADCARERCRIAPASMHWSHTAEVRPRNWAPTASR